MVKTETINIQYSDAKKCFKRCVGTQDFPTISYEGKQLVTACFAFLVNERLLPESTVFFS